MTEEEWLSCADPKSMLTFLRGRVTDRKLRLYACACCRRVGHLLLEQSRSAIAQAERYADDESLWETLIAAYVDNGVLRYEFENVHSTTFQHDAKIMAAEAVAHAASSERRSPSLDEEGGVYQPHREALCAADCASRALAVGGRAWPDLLAARSFQSHLIRDTMGDLVRPISLDRTWVTSDAVAIAKAAYEERIMPYGELDPARLAVLSDALEEAGCTDATILSHLRSPGPHVRGCWALDLLLELT